MNMQSKLKLLVLSLALATAMMLPMTVSAQRSDDFFRVDEDQYDNRVEGVIWGSIVTQDPTEPAPLGSGLLIMVAAGAGYAVARRKRSLRNGITMLLAFALLLGMTQCKKNVETIKTVEGGIPMTLEAYNGSRTSFDGSGAISWGTNEVIYVVYNGSCIGSVTNGAGGGTTFTGTVTGLESGNEYTLHYYYVGTEQTIAENATSFSMDFINQDGSLANLGKFHIGHGTQTLTYEGGTITSVAGLRSLVSIGYFDIAGMAEVGEKVYMYGENINNRISIDFSTNTITNTKGDPSHDENLICLGAVAEGATCGKYVMLVPNHTDGTETLATDITFISKRTTGTCNGSFPYGIVDNRFYCKDGDTEKPIDVAETAYARGSLRGEFSINNSGDKVHFSQGNLQAVGTTSSTSTNGWTWQFAAHQYDFIGNAAANNAVSGNGTISANGTVDLFGWSTTSTYYGINVSTTASDYSGVFKDWGENTIGVSAANYWRTLSSAEWQYIVGEDSYRTGCGTVAGVENALCTKATVNGKIGFILFPDSFSGGPTGINWQTNYIGHGGMTNSATSGWGTSIDLTNWEQLEAEGCVFLPVGYVRYDKRMIYYTGCPFGGDYAVNKGFYSSSTSKDPSTIYTLRFSDVGYDPNEYFNKAYGYSVRLVHVFN